MSSVHTGLDVRIFHKECVSVAKAGYDVHLVIDATEEEIARATLHGVTIHRLGRPPGMGRFARISAHAWHCYRIAKRLDADLYHFHDPELIPYGLLLARAGKEVIFDAHEDLPASIHSKDWVAAPARKAVASACRMLEDFGARRFSAVVAATPHIGSLFEHAARRVAVINNYPLLQELPAPRPFDRRQRDSVCYVGGISAIRGIRQLVEAIGRTESKLLLAGEFSSQGLREEISRYDGWKNVEEYGFVDRHRAAEILLQSFSGIVTFLPEPNHVNAQPNKLFEYMSAGLPVIASDFPLWRAIVEGNQCGICVNPAKPDDIAAAIRYLRDHPEQAARMGQNGRQAVEQRYRWDREESNLLSLYQAILGTPVTEANDAGIDAKRGAKTPCAL